MRALFWSSTLYLAMALLGALSAYLIVSLVLRPAISEQSAFAQNPDSQMGGDVFGQLPDDQLPDDQLPDGSLPVEDLPSGELTNELPSEITNDFPNDRPSTETNTNGSTIDGFNGAPQAGFGNLAEPGLSSGEELGSLESLLNEGYIYDPTDKRDPFQPYLRGVADLQDEREDDAPTIEDLAPLQRFDLNELKLASVIWNVDSPKAMILTPSDDVHIVTLNTKIGLNNGYIAVIREGEVVVIESFDEGGEVKYTTRVMSMD